MGKYDHLKSVVQAMSHENPDWGSDRIANEIAKSSNIENIGSLARTIRRCNWTAHKPFKQARVLLFDIETSPNLSYHFGIWNQNIRTENIVKPWCILTWSAKWLFEDVIFSEKITPEEVEERDDSRIVKRLWSVLDEADIIIAHNIRFDARVANARFIKHGLKPPSFYQTIDTLRVVRKQFKFDSNRLDDVCNFLGIEGKMETPKGLWREAVEGDEESINIMQEYCDEDVRALEDVYIELRPWCKPHPNIGLIEPHEGNTCPTCNSHDLHPDGEYRTFVNVFDNWRCGNCGSLSRSRVNSTPKKVRDTILVSNP